MLGERIRTFRKGKNITLQQLSEETGLSIGYISQIERNLVDPSLSSLRKISMSLGIPAFLLFDQERTSDVLTTRKENIIMMKKPNSPVEYHILSTLPNEEFTPQAVVVKFFLNPMNSDCDFHIVHESEEIVLLEEGELLVHLPDESIHLHSGDSTIIKSNVPHIIENISDIQAKGTLIFTPAFWRPFSQYQVD